MGFSYIHLAFNSLLTCLLVSKEWSRYADKRSPLRVSHPKGIQRSSYFISLPWRYGGPLIIGNTAMHWLMSQSVFLVNTTTYCPTGKVDKNWAWFTVGYSIRAAVVCKLTP